MRFTMLLKKSLPYRIKLYIKMAEIIDEHKITAVMITHNSEDAVNYGKRLIVLDNGKVVQDYLKPPAFSMRELKKILEIKVYNEDSLG